MAVGFSVLQGQGSVQFHSTYVQRRQAGVSYRDFQRLWRSHGDFAATVPAFWRNVDCYIHNDPVENSDGLPNVSTRYDAVGELYYTSYETWLSMRDVMWNEVAPDEKRVFAGAPLSVRGTRVVHQNPVGQYKLFTLAKSSAASVEERGGSLGEYRKYIKETLSSPNFGAALRGFTATTATRPSPESGMDSVAQTASTHDHLFVHHFESEATARAALQSADYAKLQVLESRFLDWESRIVLLCRGWILKGEQSSARID